MGRSAEDNFKKRFGDPMRVDVEYSKNRTSPSQKDYQSKQLSKAYVEVLRGMLGREPTQDEIIGKADIARHLKKRQQDEKGKDMRH